MTQKDKELLLKDLCARLPYGVKVQDELGRINKLVIGNNDLVRLYYNDFSIYSEKNLSLPCLFPLSSMTEEQKKEYDKIIYRSIELHHREYSDIVEIDLFDNLQDFYHKNHID